ncbi:MAG: hypothetical protein GY944_07445 [bacterium]|nr:hypothetical protein [bacterium]
MRFPIVLKTCEGDSPEELEAQSSKLHYVVASSGVFQVRESATHRSVTRSVSAIPGLPDEQEQLELRIPHVPSEIVGEMLGFFDEVYRETLGEGIVFLFYDPRARSFQIGVPPQRITGYYDYYGKWRASHHLDYESMPRPEGHLLLGTAHSHAAMPAYASHTDKEDERFGDGLHLVFGNFHSAQLSRSACFVASGRRFSLEPEDVMEGAEVPNEPPPRAWMKQVIVAEEQWTYSTYGRGNYASYSNYDNYASGYTGDSRGPLDKPGTKGNGADEH